MAKPKIYDSDYAIGGPYVNINKVFDTDGKCSWKTGKYVSNDGYVEIYYQWHNHIHVSFTTYINGRVYHRTISGKKYTDLGISRLAGKFLKETIKKV